MNLSRFVARLAGAIADHPTFQQILRNTITTMATLKDLDNSLAALKQTISDTATRTSAKLDDLAQKLAAALAANQPAPDLSAEIASIQDDIAALTAVAPADPAPVAPAPVDPGTPAVS